VQARMPGWLVEQLTGVFDLIRKGELADTTDTVFTLTGRNPRHFAEWARARATSF